MVSGHVGCGCGTKRGTRRAIHLLAGPEHLLYGSDYPHNIGDMQGCAERVEALPIGEEEKELIRSGNAKKLFRL